MTRVVAVFGLLVYVFLWILAANGDDNLVAPLLVPLVLVALIMAGLALDRYLGITPRKQHFRDRDEDES
jgi:membrane protease YdiL (CAAX protease family)